MPSPAPSLVLVVRARASILAPLLALGGSLFPEAGLGCIPRISLDQWVSRQSWAQALAPSWPLTGWLERPGATLAKSCQVPPVWASSSHHPPSSSSHFFSARPWLRLRYGGHSVPWWVIMILLGGDCKGSGGTKKVSLRSTSWGTPSQVPESLKAHTSAPRGIDGPAHQVHCDLCRGAGEVLEGYPRQMPVSTGIDPYHNIKFWKEHFCSHYHNKPHLLPMLLHTHTHTHAFGNTPLYLLNHLMHWLQLCLLLHSSKLQKFHLFPYSCELEHLSKNMKNRILRMITYIIISPNIEGKTLHGFISSNRR